MFKNRKIKKLIKKIIAGAEMTKEDLQLYVNHAEHIERRLAEILSEAKHIAGR